jgi:glutathione synthase
VKIAFFVNDPATERPEYTTTRLAMHAADAGHEVCYIGTTDFAYDPDESIRARARRATLTSGMELSDFLEGLADEQNTPERIRVEDLDVLFLRYDPGDDPPEQSWTRTVGIIFGELAARRGVVVVNDPTGLSRALNKMYFHHFPPEVRPKTLVTRDREEVQSFVAAHPGGLVMKPLQGSGGQNVFLIRPGDDANFNQMFDAIVRDGYVVVQEYLEAAEEGDVRLFMMNGRALAQDGVYAAFRRARAGGDFRSNVSVGAEPERVEVDDVMLGVVEMMRPKLIDDGMFLVGLDLVGDKLLEVNVFSPGGLGSAERVTGVNFTGPVLAALERKVEHVRGVDGSFNNQELATTDCS